MTELSNININLNNISTSNSDANVNKVNNSANSYPIPMVKKLTKEEIIKQLGITEAQYYDLIIKYPDAEGNIPRLTALLMKSNNVNADGSVNTSDDTTTKDTIESNNTDTQVEEELSETEKTFNKVEFNKANLEQKGQLIALELAKNKFLYTDSDNPKTEEDWNNLGEEERNNRVNQTLSAIKNGKDGISKIFKSERGQNSIADSTMSKIQAANYIGLTFEEFEKLSSEEKEEHLYSYLNEVNEFAKDEGIKPQFNGFEKEFWNRTNLLAESTNHYFKQQGIDSNVCPGDVSKIVKDKNLNLEQIQFNYLDNKVQNGKPLSKYETYQYRYLSEAKEHFSTDQKLNELANKEEQSNQVPPSLYEQIQETDYADKYNNAFAVEKAGVLFEIIRNKCGDDSTACYKELLASAMAARNNGDTALSSDLSKFAARINPDKFVQVDQKSSPAELLVKMRAVPQLSGDDAQKLRGNINKLNSKDLRVAAGISLIGHATEDQTVALSYVKSQDEEVNNELFDKGTDLNTNSAEIVFKNLRGYASQGTLNYVAVNSYKAQSELQNVVLHMYTDGNAESTQAAIDSGVVTKFDVSNQTEGLRTLKTNAEALMPEEDAINALNSLADQIKDCHKDNQLAMHNEMMTSKYSEVQEHAAGNIKDYDPTVQTKALETVLASGNEKAIEAAAESVKYSPDCVKSEMAEVIEAYASDNAIQADSAILEQFADLLPLQAKTIQEKIASGQILSENELSTLSVTERRNYFASFFKKLPVDKKIKLLASMPDSQKKTVYTLIARTDSALFNAIIKDKDRADQLLSMGLPEDVNNKIKGVVSFLAVSDIGYQNIAAKYDIAYDNNDEVAEKDKKYATKPEDFDTKEIYKKDKKGNILA